jgi:hypothetical protein
MEINIFIFGYIIMADLHLIPLRSNLLANYKYIEVKNKIIARIQELHLNDGKFKLDSELLVLVCNLIEHLIVKKDNISKKEIAVDIIKTLFGLSADEETAISNNIQFIWSNGMIKKVSQYKLFKVGFKEWFKRKS